MAWNRRIVSTCSICKESGGNDDGYSVPAVMCVLLAVLSMILASVRLMTTPREGIREWQREWRHALSVKAHDVSSILPFAMSIRNAKL